jgi:hypothetical protein
MIRVFAPLALVVLSACAMQEELVEEPVLMEEDIARVTPDEDCNMGDDDGIGGTGCEPVARMAHPWR